MSDALIGHPQGCPPEFPDPDPGRLAAERREAKRARLAEARRIRLLPGFMRPSRLYAEEFRPEPGDRVGPQFLVRVVKGHSPHDFRRYTYEVELHTQAGVPPLQSKLFPAAVYRIEQEPRRWVNQTGVGYCEPSPDGRRLVWTPQLRARSERWNSIISKAKAQLTAMLRHDAMADGSIWPTRKRNAGA